MTWKVVAQRAFEMLKDNRLAIYRDHIYRPIIAQAENDVAVQVCEMLRRDKLPYMGDLDDEIDAQQKEMGFTFAQEQRNAIKTSLTSPIWIISGGPGTGRPPSSGQFSISITRHFPMPLLSAVHRPGVRRGVWNRALALQHLRYIRR